ncbi:RHS domain-containing protein, partial [Streptomyces sp. SID7804]|uniref:RHS domain-containing protein n=1 Tax=Streptomyces sp. SID7804 TaxID=2690327 RepID=UPI0031F5F229
MTPTWQGSWGNDQRKRRFRRTAGCCINCNSSRFRFFAIVTDLVGTPTELIDDQGNTAWRTRSTLW